MPPAAENPRLRLEILEARDNPSLALPNESFNSVAAPALPAGWLSWSNDGAIDVSTAAGAGIGGTTGAVVVGTSKTEALTWFNQALDPNTGASVSVFANSLVPAMVFVRGQGLSTATPSYLAAVVTRGLAVDLVQVTNGQATVLASLTSPGSSYLSNQWVQVSIVPNGSSTSVTVVRQDTGQYLNAGGTWQTAATTALSAAVAAPTGNGVIGFGREAQYSGSVRFDNFAAIAAPVPTPPPTSPAVSANFNALAVGATPPQWGAWSSGSSSGFAVSAPQDGDSTNTFSSASALSTAAARAWTNTDLTAAASVSASIYLNSLIPAQVFARGSGLTTATPTYYAVEITRGLQAQLVRVVNGVSTTLATVKSTAYFSNGWARIQLTTNGNQIQVAISRTDTNQWLTSNGSWSATPAIAMQATDSTIGADGAAGVGRAPGYAGQITFDDFVAQPVNGGTSPQVTLLASGNNSATGYSGVVVFQAAASSGSAPVANYLFQLNGVAQANSTSGSWTLDTTTIANGNYTLTVEASDTAGDSASANFAFVVSNPIASSFPVPTAPQHNPNIRIAELAYSGNPMGSIEKSLLQSSVDLVIDNPQYFQTVQAIAPATPQLIYSNLSNLYDGVLTSWLDYANANGISPESAFYHVTQATPFSGESPSSQPVDWFWSAYQAAAAGGTPTDVTSAARGGAGTINWGAAGQTLNLGYTDPFRLVNVTVTQPASAGWNGVWEYATAGPGGQTVWKTLTLLQDGTNNLTRSGTVTFDPPASWSMTAEAAGEANYYYIRFRVTSGSASQAAVTSSILGDDYVHANGGTSGIIPAFDAAADTNHDGYLSDAEYAKRAPGMDARFAYQSRLFYPSYGQERFVTDPSAPAVQQWAASYDAQILKANPLASGLFLDNSTGEIPFSGVSVQESTATYGSDFGKMVTAVHQAVGSKWVVANVSGGTTASVDPVAKASTAVFEESLLRPMTVTWSSVGDVANTVNQLLNVDKTPYVILDSSAVGGSATDGRTTLATLAYYDLVGDPKRTFLMFYGGDNPASTWSQHWSPAATVNIGQPTGAMTTIATGKDPANTALNYEVFGRSYSDGLVLFKPLSYTLGVGTGTTADNTATSVSLGGLYHVVNADGTVSTTAVSSISLRNGEGAVLLKA